MRVDCNDPSSDALIAFDPQRLDCVLAAGDVGDLEQLRAWCASLRPDSYGQIFIEVFAPFQIEQFDAPRNIGVTWICRERLRPSTRPGVGIPRGKALADAVDAWLDEWLRVEPESRHFTLWMGAHSSSIMRSFWARIEREVSELWPGGVHRQL